jgi:DNA-binding beta-propeller fold protein YncE
MTATGRNPIGRLLLTTSSALVAVFVCGCPARPRLQPMPNAGAVKPAVEPGLVRYRQAGKVETGLQEPRGIAVGPGGRLYVVGDQVIRVLEANGTPVSQFAVGGEPHAVAVTEDGSLYVAMRDHVEVFDAGGARKAAWPSPGERAYLTCVAVAGGDVWVADAGNRVVLRYDMTGRISGRLGEKDPTRKVPGLVIPSPHLDVVPAPDGLLWVNNPGRRVVETYAPDGSLKSSWGESSVDIEGFCGCCNPTDIALLPDGNVVTSEKGLPRVKVYRQDGTLESVVAPAEAFSPGTSGLDLATDAEGRVFVLDPSAKAVRIFERVRQGEP